MRSVISDLEPEVAKRASSFIEKANREMLSTAKERASVSKEKKGHQKRAAGQLDSLMELIQKRGASMSVDE